jgi:hypothetical protein
MTIAACPVTLAEANAFVEQRHRHHKKVIGHKFSIGTRNACSFLYGAAARAAFALGYRRIGTYILASEPGKSLVSAGWRMIGEVRGRSWSCQTRPRVDKHPTTDKTLWELEI